ncbi:MAG: FAD-dependent thymidylate synthase [Nanoarchaeota archaeon]
MAKRKYEFLSEVPEETKQKISRYVTNVEGDTFVIHGLPPEMTGGLLARYSRAPTGLQLTLVNEFLDENDEPSQAKGTDLINRVLNAFGDESVGELEPIHVGIENISQIGTKFIEDRRIGGSPIEQSTRYVKYDKKDEQGKWRYLRPKEIIRAGLLKKFERANDRAFELYSSGIEKLSELFEKQFPRDEFAIEISNEKRKFKERELTSDEQIRTFNNAYNFTIRCAALDVGRCVLPSSTLTHLGVLGNGRFFTNVLTYLKTNTLQEAKDRAEDLEAELNKIIPTYIKRNRVNENQKEVDRNMKEIAKMFDSIAPKTDKVTLVLRADLINELVSSALFPYTNISLQQILNEVEKMSLEKKKEILHACKGERCSRRDRTGRGLEAGYPITFDLVGCFAEYRDLQRHRMLTQQRQNLTAELGFIIPPEMIEVGLEKEINEVESMMRDLNADIKHAGQYEASQYATLFNHKMRFMLGMNFREFQHLSELRTQPAGHFSYRSMVMEMADKVKARYPWSEELFEFVDYSDPGNKISRAKEQSRIAGKNLSAKIDGSIDL